MNIRSVKNKQSLMDIKQNWIEDYKFVQFIFK